MTDHNEDNELSFSCACFDSQGRLVDWNAGFESEFHQASSSLASGTYFRDILQQAYQKDHVIRVYIPNPDQPHDASEHMDRWPQNLGTVQNFKYWDQGMFVHVQEHRTVSRGVIRLAFPDTNEAPTPSNQTDDSTRVEAQSRAESTNTTTEEQDRLLRNAALETSNSILLLRLRAEQKLKSLSITDSLTGLANRRHFSETLEAKWQRALNARDSIGILIADVDYFKRYNDHYGHTAGDTCLKQVAAKLSENMRQGLDLVARFGGEEFAVILPGTDMDAASAAAERACNGVATLQEEHIAGVDGIVTVSIGVAAVVPTPDMSSQTLIDSADAALYEAKLKGRNRIVCAKSV